MHIAWCGRGRCRRADGRTDGAGRECKLKTKPHTMMWGKNGHQKKGTRYKTIRLLLLVIVITTIVTIVRLATVKLLLLFLLLLLLTF